MNLHSIQLKNVTHFASIELKLNQQPVILILGDQGSGKTSLLKHIFQALTWFSARYKDHRSAGMMMLDQDIFLGRQQAKINICVRIATDIAQLNSTEPMLCCDWQLYKTLSEQKVGVNQATLGKLDSLVALYHQAQQQDPMQGAPLIAYYPADGLLPELNLLSKNNPQIFQTMHAYDFSIVPVSTFNRFFEWLREIHDIENAQVAQLLTRFMQQPKSSSPLNEQLLQTQQQLYAPSLLALNQALHCIFPEIDHLHLHYHPRLQLMVNYQGQLMQYLQLPQSLRHWIALIGDVVRRLCLLNPKSLYPCLEGEGILIIDAIDHHLDQAHAQNILLRLHQSFPRLQIIASSSRAELLENLSDYQCYYLNEQHIHPMPAHSLAADFDRIYANLNPSTNSAQTQNLSTENTQQPVQQLFEQIQQQLSIEQQIELIRRLQDDQANCV